MSIAGSGSRKKTAGNASVWIALTVSSSHQFLSFLDAACDDAMRNEKQGALFGIIWRYCQRNGPVGQFCGMGASVDRLKIHTIPRCYRKVMLVEDEILCDINWNSELDLMNFNSNRTCWSTACIFHVHCVFYTMGGIAPWWSLWNSACKLHPTHYTS